MTMKIDEARRRRETRRVDLLVCRSRGQWRTDRGEAVARHPDVASSWRITGAVVDLSIADRDVDHRLGVGFTRRP